MKTEHKLSLDSFQCPTQLSATEAEEVLHEILERARRTPENDQRYSNVLNSLLKQCPNLKLNVRLEFGEKLEHPAWDHIYFVTGPDRKIPHRSVYNTDVYDLPYGGSWVEFTRCTPLRIAAIYNLDHIMDVLLKQPSIDVTVDNAYGSTGFFSSVAKKMRHAHLEQFCREALVADNTQLPKLIEKHHFFGIKSDAVRKFMFDTVMKSVQSLNDPDEKIKMLMLELKQAYPQPFTGFLGKELDVLKNQLMQEINKLERRANGENNQWFLTKYLKSEKQKPVEIELNKMNKNKPD